MNTEQFSFEDLLNIRTAVKQQYARLYETQVWANKVPGTPLYMRHNTEELNRVKELFAKVNRILGQ
jgi:hypothetical protein